MRATRAAAVGVFVGAALGAGGSALARHRDPAPTDVGSGPLERAAGTPSEEAGLAAAPPESRPARGSVVCLDLRLLHDPVVPDAAKGEGATHVPAWVWVARAHARAGRWGTMRDVVLAALDAGGSTAEAHALLRWMPDEERRAAYAALRARGHEAAIDRWLEAVAAKDDDPGRSFERLLGLVREKRADVGEAARRLGAIDARRADVALGEVAERDAWGSPVLRFAADGFRLAGAKDVASAWDARAGAKAREEAAVLRAARRARIAKRPDDPQAWLDLSRLQDGEGDRAGAVASLRKALELDAFADEAIAELLRLDPAAGLPYAEAARERTTSSEVIGLLARVYLARGRTSEALDLVLRLPDGDAGEWWEAGAAALDPGRVLRWLDLRPRRAEFLRARGDALAALGRAGAAFDAYRAAFEAGQRGRTFLLALAAASPVQATALLEEARRVAPDDDYEVALGEARRLATGGGDPGPRVRGLADDGDEWASVVLAAAGDAPTLARLETATREDPENAWAWWALAEALARLGRTREATAARARAVALEPHELPWLVRAAVP
jgi:tetratricopeptide (TPR) repeat protein